jgi:ADP-ribosylglycohydrolase
MIIHGAIGDTYGAGFEFAERAKIQEFNTVTQYERHPRYLSIYKKYTDDTQMAIAIAELLLSENDWNEILVAEKFMEVFKRDKRDGYSKRIYNLLNEAKSGKELLSKNEFKSEGNGAAMRSYPLGIIKDKKELLDKSYLQAIVTHDTAKAVRSSQAVALMVHYFLYKKDRKGNLITYLSDEQKYIWKGNWKGEVSADATETVEAVITILSKGSDLKSMLKQSVEFGGDTDTVASLVLAIGSLTTEFENDLPQWMYADLEKGKFGKGYMEILDQKLLKKIKNI